MSTTSGASTCASWQHAAVEKQRKSHNQVAASVLSLTAAIRACWMRLDSWQNLQVYLGVQLAGTIDHCGNCISETCQPGGHGEGPHFHLL